MTSSRPRQQQHQRTPSPPPDKDQQLWFYQSVMPLQYNLVERIRVAFEENLPEQGLEIFDSVVFSGFSTPGEQPTPGLMPPPTFLRFVITLMAHPFHTTQLRKGMLPSKAPIAAYMLVHRIIKIIGPVNASLDKIWVFDRGRRSVRRGNRENRELSPSADDAISGELANEESLFSRVEDVWDVVGWAFTCSVLHPARWTWWGNVLECLLLTLETDWDYRREKYKNAGEKAERVLRESIAVKMLPETRGTGGYRRVVRAILANGSAKAQEFHPVWEDELFAHRPKKKGQRTLGGFMGEFGDDEETKTPKKTDKTLDENDDPLDEDDDIDIDMSDAPPTPSTYDSWGGVTAFSLRQRFLTLLSDLSTHGQFIATEDLYLEYKNNISHLPLSSFSLFFNTLTPAGPDYRGLFTQFILEQHLSTSRTRRDSALTQDLLVRHYLPYPANTMALLDNAKVAVVLEALMRLMLKCEYIVYTPELDAAVEAGIAARAKKAKTPARGKVPPEEVLATKLLWNVAEESLRMMVRMVKAKEVKA